MQSNNYFVPLLQEYLKHFGILSKRKELQLLLQTSYSFPSVLSIIQTCSYFGLKSKAYKADYKDILANKMPAIAHLKENVNEKFVMIYEASNECLTYYDVNSIETVSLTPDEFCEKWTGIIIISERVEEERIVHDNNSLKQFGIISLYLIAVLTSFSYNIQSLTVFTIVTFIVKCVGIWLTYNLIRHEKGIPSSLSESFCRKKVSFDCNKVLKSKVSIIFNSISLADIGLIYFITGSLALVLSNFVTVQNEILLMLFYLSASLMPIVLFLIFYQKIVVRKWCPLCLNVVGVIVFEMILFLLFPNKLIVFDNIQSIIVLFLSIIVSILILNNLKSHLKQQIKLLAIKIEILRMKRNPFILTTAFGQQELTDIPHNNQIIIGNKNAPITITTLLSPLCLHCTKQVNKIISLLKKHPQKIMWQIRFDGIEANEYHPINQIQLHLMQLCNNKSDDMKLQIISDWYHKQSVQWFKKKYPIKEISITTISEYAEQSAGNRMLNIKRIPTVWINNRKLPEEYNLEDIPFLLTDLNLLLKLTK